MNYKFEKKLAISRHGYRKDFAIFRYTNLLLQHMIECNEKNKHEFDYFCLTFRPQRLDEEISREFPLNTEVLEMHWGCKEIGDE